MAETLETIRARRSTRAYTDEPVAEELIQNVLEAGMWAPTGSNSQSPIIVCITEKTTRDALANLNASFWAKDADPFYGAPVACAVLTDTNAKTHLTDANLVIENMLLAAYDQGLGGCYIARAKECFESAEGKQMLADWGIEGDYVGVGIVIFGHTTGEEPAPKPRKENWVYRIK